MVAFGLEAGAIAGKPNCRPSDELARELSRSRKAKEKGRRKISLVSHEGVRIPQLLLR
jgi:hypothetical protein